MASKNIKIYYQPKFDSVYSTMVGAEALSRWKETDGTIISPLEFIPLLEKTELITKLDWYVLESVCQFLKSMLEQNIPVVTISVNFSRIHTQEKDFIQHLVSIVDGYGLPRDLIEIEITESALSHDSDIIIQFITEIRNSGFDVSIDDFGSGLSSLSFVKDVPANVLKIDKSLLSSNCENEKERIVLESIFDFAHRLNLKTVAEGVETKEQLGFLRTCDCQMIQGFIFSKPLEEEIFTEVLVTVESKKSHRDIIFTQAHSTAGHLLINAVYSKFEIVGMTNISRDSFYFMKGKDFTARNVISTGVFSEFLNDFIKAIHPDDVDLYLSTFSIENHLRAFRNNEKYLSCRYRVLAGNGKYVINETSNYFVENKTSSDIVAISFTEIIPERP